MKYLTSYKINYSLRTKEDIAYKETSGIFNEYELGITGLANAMEIYAKEVAIAFMKWNDEKGYCLCENSRWESLSDFSSKTDDELFNQFIEESLNKQP